MKNAQIQTPFTSAVIESGRRRLNTKHRGLPADRREDVLQDSLIDLMDVVERGGRVENPAAFLAVIIDRTAATAATKLAELREHEVPAGGFDELAAAEHERKPDKGDYSATTIPEFTAESQMFTTAFDQAVRGLPEYLRDVFIAVDLRGMSQDEAAPKLGLTQSTLSRRLDIARDLMKEAL